MRHWYGASTEGPRGADSESIIQVSLELEPGMGMLKVIAVIALENICDGRDQGERTHHNCIRIKLPMVST
jgi:hypothetical protein